MTLKVNYGYFSGVGGIAGNTRLPATNIKHNNHETIINRLAIQRNEYVKRQAK